MLSCCHIIWEATIAFIRERERMQFCLVGQCVQSIWASVPDWCNLPGTRMLSIMCCIQHLDFVARSPFLRKWWRHFLSQNVDTFTRTSFRVLKMNVIARAQLTFQISTLLKKYLFHQSQYQKIWDSNCLILIAQMVRAFGVHSKVGGSSALRSRHFLKNFDTLTRTSIRVSKMNAVVCVQLTFQTLL